MSEDEEKSYGQLAYEAFWEALDWLPQGEWVTLRKSIQDAWEAAGLAVASEQLTRL